MTTKAPTKRELADQIVRLENPDTAEEEALAFSAEAMEKGFKKEQLQERLRKLLEPPAPEEPRALAAGEPLDGGESQALEARPDSTLPALGRWDQLKAMSQDIARSKLTPSTLQGEPDSVLLVLLGAHDLGIPSTQALSKLVVVDGKLSMMAELMVGLVFREGHRLWPDPNNDGRKATAYGQRREADGWGPVVEVSFTLEDAEQAGLVGIRDGKPYARSQGGKRLPWEVYTADMLWARAVSRLCRRSFPDCLSGVSYTPDELGYIDARMGSEEPAPDEPSVTLNEKRSEIARRIANLEEPEKRTLWEEWTRRNWPKAKELSAGAIRQATQLLDQAEAAARERKGEEPDVEEAEVVQAAEEGAEAAPSGGEPGPVDTAEPASAPPGEEFCTGCGEAIPEGQVSYGNDSKPWHAECAPFL